ncbi:MAG: DUF3568 family protein [Gemmatimonas sp.]|nr:DUF3568 family protein [Gemmatimonas sp.]
MHRLCLVTTDPELKWSMRGMNIRSKIKWISLLAFTAIVGACGAALAAGAGAGAAIAYSERGVSSSVNASLDETAAATRAVFADMEIAAGDQQWDDDRTEHEIKGSRGDLDVTVDMEQKGSGMVGIDVVAREGTLDYDREYAREILSSIVAQLS